ncbi:hypothetical protein JW752_00820 [Candidatus Peregrinibacteria bacterium]|nr:hypothetical protein [Candidatus Peregrinibacteria bacterium]
MENDFVTFDRDRMEITVHPEGGRDLVINKDSVDISYFSGGPGGQNVNRNLKGVQLIFRIPDTYRRESQKTQQLVTRVMGKRSLHHNLQAAFEQLTHKVRQYFYVPPVRRKTKKPKRADEKRLKNKKIKSLKKQDRGKVQY